MSNLKTNKVSSMEKKQTWRIFKKKKTVLNSCAIALAISTQLFFAGAASANVAAGALPTGGTYVSGTGTIGTTGNTMNINQTSQYGVINFDGFNVGSQAGVNVANGSGATLGRVTGSGTSYINGEVNATGSLYLINRNGVVIGNQGVVTTGGNFGVSTADVDNAQFMQNGAFNPTGAGIAPIANLGSIKSERGNVTLYGSQVANAGSIEAANGKVSIKAEGNATPASMRALLGDAEYENTFVETDAQILNTGDIKAAQIDLQARGNNIFSYAINNKGRVRATGVENQNGKVVLTSEGGNVLVSGTVSAHNANGSGGEVYIGGGFQGKDASIANAANTTIAQGAVIDVSGQGNKDGGKAIVWSDKRTELSGKINASSGAQGGKGGFVEVSGKENLAIATLKNVDVRGVDAGGELLLDPNDITIVDGSGNNITTQPDENGNYTSNYVRDNVLNDQDIADWLNDASNGASTTLTIQTNKNASGGNGDITFENGTNITWNTNSSLIIDALRDTNFKGTTIVGNGQRSSIIVKSGRDINFTGKNFLTSGPIGQITLSAAGGNWQSGLGAINFGTKQGDITSLSSNNFYLFSGKKADGSRSDLNFSNTANYSFVGRVANPVGVENVAPLLPAPNHFGTIDLRGFNKVTLKSIEAGMGDNNPFHISNYLKVYAKDIVVQSDLKLGGSLHLVAAAFDNTTNNFTTNPNEAILNSDNNTDKAGELSDGWNQNEGTVVFDTASNGGLINITSCCELIIKSGTSVSGRTSLTSQNVAFNYVQGNDKYSLVDIAGFDVFETNFQGDNLKAIEYVKLRNVNNVIRDNIRSKNILSWSTQDTVIEGATIGGYNTANANAVAIIVDEQNPTSAGIYGLKIDANSSINANKVAIYSSTQGQTIIDGKINANAFVKGPEFLNNANETWTGFYSVDDGYVFGTGIANPFMVYYKNTQPIAPQSDCQVNPSAPGCANFVNLINDRVEYRIARTTFGSRVEQAVASGEYLAASNSGMNLPNETFTKNGNTYLDDRLYTLSEKLGSAAYGLPLQVVEDVLGGAVAALPGIQGVVDKANFQTIPGAVAELARIPSTFLVATPTILANILGGTIGAVGDVVGGVGGAIGSVVLPSNNTNPVVAN